MTDTISRPTASLHSIPSARSAPPWRSPARSHSAASSSARERILALEPRDECILAYTISTDAEVRKLNEIFGGISDKAVDPAMISIAEKIIEQHEGPFDPGQFVDRYAQAPKALIENKKMGHQPAKVA